MNRPMFRHTNHRYLTGTVVGPWCEIEVTLAKGTIVFPSVRSEESPWCDGTPEV